jgi:hypothetical protein
MCLCHSWGEAWSGCLEFAMRMRGEIMWERARVQWRVLEGKDGECGCSGLGGIFGWCARGFDDEVNEKGEKGVCRELFG